MRTLRTELKHLAPLESRVLTDMCICSKNLYNVALFEVRRKYRETGKTMSYPKIDKWAREHKTRHYKKLTSVNAQETLGKLGEDYASYFALLKKPDLHFKPRPPRYKKDSGLFNLIFNARAFQVQDGKIRLSLSKYHKNRFQIRDGYLYLSVSNFVTDRSIKTLEIVPLGYGRFDLHIKYEETALEAAPPQAGDNILALDPGVSNFCTAASTLGDAFILSGLEMKSVNRQWNKNRARLQSATDLTEDKWRKERLREELTSSTLKRNRRIQDILHKMSHNLVEYAVENGISCIVAGYNAGWKHEVNIGSANNQKFVCIPHRRFLDYVKYKAARYGIEFRVQEESYTSRCDSLALEAIEKHEKYMGRRKHRGLYKSSTGRVLNADVNGALNILRKHLFSNVKKSKGKDESELIARIVSMGRVFRPRKTAWGSSPCSPKPSSKGFGIHMPAPLGAGS